MRRSLATIFAIVFALLTLTSLASANSLGAIASSGGGKALPPCPGPSYASHPAGTAVTFGARKGSLGKISHGNCKQPRTGPFTSPTLCSTHFVGYGAPFSLMTCSYLPQPLCATRPAHARYITGTDLNLQVPGYVIYKVLGNGTFTVVSAIRGSGGVYIFVRPGHTPVYQQPQGSCIPIPPPVPLPPTGAGATSASVDTVSAGFLPDWIRVPGICFAILIGLFVALGYSRFARRDVVQA